MTMNKLVSFFLLLIVASSSNAQDDCSCTDYDLFEFETCSFKAIRMTISGGMSQRSSCTHSFFEEIKCITGAANNKKAKKAIVQMCEGGNEEPEEPEEPPVETPPPDTPSPTASPSASPTIPVSPDTCIDWTDGLQIEDGCTYNSILERVKDSLNNNCPHGAEEELELALRASDEESMKEALDTMCKEGWEDVDKSQFKDIDSRFNAAFMREYINGETFLNRDTGSFQNTQEGNNIKNFHNNEAKKSKLVGFNSPLDNCSLNSMMCCFGRDRQPNDNNGNCANPLDRKCTDADPADNSNLCYTTHNGQFFTRDSEDDIHCHGLAWADESGDFTNQLKFNNLFYVSLYDHMYQRGYAGKIVDDYDEMPPMCSCMEDMGMVVSRSDCTQIDATMTFTIKYNTNYELTAVPGNDLQIQFNSCQGINPGNGNAQGNDLASYVYRLFQEGKLSHDTKTEIFKTLAGYANPGDNQNDKACWESHDAEVGPNEPVNIASYGAVTQSSVAHGGYASKAIDGNVSSRYGRGSITHTKDKAHGDDDPYWRVDLRSKTEISKIVVWNRMDCCSERLSNSRVAILEDGDEIISFSIGDSFKKRRIEFEVDSIVGDAVVISQTNDEALSLAEVEVFGVEQNPMENLAFKGAASQSSTGYGGAASRAIDGDASSHWGSNSITHTADGDNNPWWKVDLRMEAEISKIVVYNRMDCCSERLSNSEVVILQNGDEKETYSIGDSSGERQIEFDVNSIVGDAVIIYGQSNSHLSLSQVEVYGTTILENVALKGTVSQSSTSYGGSARKAIDGKYSSNFSDRTMTHTAQPHSNPWWKVDLERKTEISQIYVWNRLDCCSERLSNTKVIIYEDGVEKATLSIGDAANKRRIDLEVNDITGDSIMIRGNSGVALTLDEVEIFGTEI